MPLDNERRIQLDSIVADLDSQGASLEEVQSIVNDFLSKYDTKTEPSPGATTYDAVRSSDADLRGFLRPKPGLHIPDLEMPSMSDYGMGMQYGFAKELLTEQAPKLGEGIYELGKSIDSLTPTGMTRDLIIGTSPQDFVNQRKEFLSGMVHSILDPINNYMFQDVDAGITERVLNTSSALLGGDPARAQELYNQGDNGGAFAAYAGIPFVSIASGEFTRGKVRKPKVPTTGTSGVALEAGATLMQKGVRQAEKQSSYNVSQTVHPILQQAYNEKFGGVMRGAAKTYPAREGPFWKHPIEYFTSRHRSPNSRLRTTAESILDTVDYGVEIAERPINKALAAFSKQKVPGVQQSILRDLEIEIANQAKIDPPLSNALKGLYDSIKSEGSTVAGLDKIKKLANKKTQAVSRQSEAQQIAATAQPVEAYRIAANSIRNHLYPEIERMGGPNLFEYGQREAAMLQYRDGIYSAYKTADSAQAHWSSASFLERVLEHTGGSWSDRAAASRIARALGILESPMGQFNQLFGRNIGNIGRDFINEQVFIEAIPAELLPKVKGLLPATTGEYAPYGQYTFTIPGIGQEAAGVVKGVVPETLKEFRGTVKIPNELHTPVEPKPPAAGTSYFRQGQDYGPAVETIPERARGVRSPAKIRQDELGSTQNALPERAFTGPETTMQSDWYVQLMNPEPGLPGAGTQFMMQTTSPEVAATALKNIKSRLKTKTVQSNPALRIQLEEAANTLEHQLQGYRAYQSVSAPPSVKIKVTPSQPGSIPKHGKTKAVTAGAGVSGITGASVPESEEEKELQETIKSKQELRTSNVM